MRVGLILELDKVRVNEYSIIMRMRPDSISHMSIEFWQWANQEPVEISQPLKSKVGLRHPEPSELDINQLMLLLTDVEPVFNQLQQLKTVSLAKEDHR